MMKNKKMSEKDEIMSIHDRIIYVMRETAN